MNLKEKLDQGKKIIDVNKQLRQTGTLSATSIKPEGLSNMYVWFVYIKQTIFNHTRGQVSG